MPPLKTELTKKSHHPFYWSVKVDPKSILLASFLFYLIFLVIHRTISFIKWKAMYIIIFCNWAHAILLVKMSLCLIDAWDFSRPHDMAQMSSLCVLSFSLKCKAQILTITSGWCMPWQPCICLLCYLRPPFLTLLLPYCTLFSLFSSSNLPIMSASGFRPCRSFCLQFHSLSHSQDTLLCFLFSVVTFSSILRYFLIDLKFHALPYHQKKILLHLPT